MGKILVIYHSQQYGNTRMPAEALAEGAQEAGAEVNLISTNERRVTLEEFLAADAVAIGTPDYFSYLAGTIKTFFNDMYLWDLARKFVKGKPAVLFCSHSGGGGKVKQPLESFAHRFFGEVGETVGSGRLISEEAKKSVTGLVEHLLRTLIKRNGEMGLS